MDADSKNPKPDGREATIAYSAAVSRNGMAKDEVSV